MFRASAVNASHTVVFTFVGLYGMVDGCTEKSHVSELQQKQALQVAAFRNRKNIKHDQSKIPRSASTSAWNHSWLTRQEVPSGTPNHNATT